MRLDFALDWELATAQQQMRDRIVCRLKSCQIAQSTIEMFLISHKSQPVLTLLLEIFRAYGTF